MKSRRTDAHEIRRDPPEAAAAHRARARENEIALVRDRVRALPNVRQEIVATLREDIRNGRYRSDSQSIAKAMIEESALLRRALPVVLDDALVGSSGRDALTSLYLDQARLFVSMRTLVMRQRQALLEGDDARAESLDAEGRVLSERFRALERERTALEESLDEPLDDVACAAKRLAGDALQTLLCESAIVHSGGLSRSGDES